MKGKSAAIAVVAVVAALVCVVAVLAIKMNNSSKVPVATDPLDVFATVTESEETFPVYPDEKYPSLPDFSSVNPYYSFTPVTDETLTQPVEVTEEEEETTAVEDETTTAPQSETTTVTERKPR